jgi:hypothetical protein
MMVMGKGWKRGDHGCECADCRTSIKNPEATDVRERLVYVAHTRTSESQNETWSSSGHSERLRQVVSTDAPSWCRSPTSKLFCSVSDGSASLENGRNTLSWNVSTRMPPLASGLMRPTASCWRCSATTNEAHSSTRSVTRSNERMPEFEIEQQ